MCKAVTILFLITFCNVVASAQQNNLEVKLLNNNKILLAPGITTNLGIKLVNNTKEDELITLKIQLPKGWKCFSNLNDIPIPNALSVLKILSINIPSYAPPGDYLIIIEAIDSHNSKLDEIKLPLTIKPKYALKVDLINGSEFVFAGDSVSFQFMIQNISNQKAKFEVSLNGAGIDEKMNFIINPDSSMFINRKIRTAEGILNSVTRNVTLTASLADNPEVNSSNYFSYNVIPGNDVKPDPYIRFPIKLSTLFMTNNPRGERLYAQMFDIAGKGFIDEKNIKLLNFHMQGPDRIGQPLYGIYDEYFLEYTSPKSKYLLGDKTYNLSYLTEFSRYGRGGKVEHAFKHFMFGSFINYPRFYPKIKREISAYGGYSMPNIVNLNFGYLNKLDNKNEANNIFTFNGAGTPFRWINLDWEYALGTVHDEYKHAFKTEVKVNYRSVHLFYNYTWAQKGFPGYLTDTRYMLANGSINLSPKLNFVVNYNYMYQNIALDSLYGNAPFSKNIFFTLNYELMKNGGISASYYSRQEQDRMVPMQFNYNENTLRLCLNKRISNFGFCILGEYGQTENLLLSEKERIKAFYQGQFTLNFKASEKLNINSFVRFQENNHYNVNNSKNWVYGGSVNGSITKKLSLYISYQNSYEIEESYHNRSIVDGRLIFMPNKANRIEISSWYYLTKNSLDVKELFVMGKYVHTFNIPTSKKKNIGKLSGRIINKGVKTIEGIVLSIGSDQAVTDKIGNYSFPMLPAGNYYLMIDYSKAGVFAVPETPGPYQVEILPGRESRFDIALTLAAKITGAVSILKDISDEDKSYAGIRDRLGKLLVEAKNGSEVYRIFTKEDGQFAFESLRPGPWTVRVYEAGIPNEYQLVTDQFNIGLASGKEEHIEVKIKEVRRRIKFQKSIDITPDFETTKPAVPGSKKTDSSSKNNKPVKTAKRVVKTPEKITRIDTAQVKKQIRVVSVKGKESKSTSQNLEYRIQVGSYDKPLVSTDKLAAKLNITEKIEEDLFNGHYIYTIGSFKSQREAAIRNKEIQKNASTSGSFIVSFRDGTRTTKLEKPELAEK